MALLPVDFSKLMRIIRPTSLLYTTAMALILGGGTAVVGIQATPYGGWIGVVPALIVIGVGLRQPLRRWRATQTPCPASAQRWLQQHVPFYAALDADAQARFERDVQIFIDEHSFEGIEGVTVTDDLRLGVAAGAALLLHGRPDWELEGTSSVLFYPDAFDDQYFGGDYADYDGMAHEQGPILLSARAVEESWADPTDGSNVVLHELAHLFDFKNEGADGIPSLLDPASEAAWQKLVRREMKRVRRRQSLLRPYAATAPSEFFAVAVEVFFEQPGPLKEEHPELFNALRSFFALDPRKNRAEAVQPE
jgi:hypothetical protein